jgi:hypothetical protein
MIAEAKKEKENRMKMQVLINHSSQNAKHKHVFAISPLMSALSTLTPRHK